MEKLLDEGVLFNKYLRLEYKISSQKNSIYDKPQRRFEINIYKLKKSKNELYKVMHLPEENFMAFIKEMKFEPQCSIR